MLAAGVVPALCHSLQQDAKTATVSLEAIEQFLQKAQDDVQPAVEGCGGADALKMLTSHANPEIASKAQALLQRFFAKAAPS